MRRNCGLRILDCGLWIANGELWVPGIPQSEIRKPKYDSLSRLKGFVLLGILSLIAGCGSSTGTVSGKVSHRGKPVASGTVTLMSEAGVRIQARIKPDGTYRASLPLGQAKVGVQVTAATGLPPIVAPRLPANLRGAEDATVPLLYRDPERSPLRCQVTRGEQVFDIDLP